MGANQFWYNALKMLYFGVITQGVTLLYEELQFLRKQRRIS